MVLSSCPPGTEFESTLRQQFPVDKERIALIQELRTRNLLQGVELEPSGVERHLCQSRTHLKSTGDVPKPAVLYCKACKGLLCKECAAAIHDMMPHDKFCVPVGEMPCTDDMCPEHKIQFTFFCMTERKLLCAAYVVCRASFLGFSSRLSTFMRSRCCCFRISLILRSVCRCLMNSPQMPPRCEGHVVLTLQDAAKKESELVTQQLTALCQQEAALSKLVEERITAATAIHIVADQARSELDLAEEKLISQLGQRKREVDQVETQRAEHLDHLRSDAAQICLFSSKALPSFKCNLFNNTVSVSSER